MQPEGQPVESTEQEPNPEDTDSSEEGEKYDGGPIPKSGESNE